MTDEITDVKPSDVEFLEEIREGKYSSIFKVLVRGRLCVMKVHHARARTEYENPKREHDLFTREVTSYRRLKEKGLCARGVVPDFYGAVSPIRLEEWPDTLRNFKHDEVPPSGIFIEYIPNLHWIDLTNYSEERLAKFSQILDEIHDLWILHDDPYPRNMLVAKGEEGQEDRVLWIDFDAAWTNLPDDAEHRTWFQEEKMQVKEFARFLTQDYAEGKVNKTWRHYYTYN